MAKRLAEIMSELALAYAEHGDIELDGGILDLAVMAFVMTLYGEEGSI